MLDQPRRFHLQRDTDPTGISGTGRIADGIAWTDGTATIQWLGERPSITTWYRPGAGMSDAEWVHTHGFTTDTRIVWEEGSPDQTAVLEAEMRSKHSAIMWRDMAGEAEEATRRDLDEARTLAQAEIKRLAAARDAALDRITDALTVIHEWQHDGTPNDYLTRVHRALAPPASGNDNPA
jgi:hypothetical protein